MNRSPREFLTNLYRDFRDRGLLIPAGLLVAALIAVPVFLSQSAPPAPSVAQTQQIEATAATPAVLTESAGVRDYRKRLRQLKRNNPFEQQFTGPTGGGGGEIFELDLGDAGDGGGEASDSVDLDGSGGGGRPDDVATGGGQSASSPSTDESSKPQEPEAHWFTWEVDLSFGPPREAERFEGVRVMEFLPSRKDAVAVMAGAGLQGNRVGFMFLPDVIASKGDGKCAPGPRNCTFLVLKKGEQHRVTVIGPEGDEVTYRIKVHDITVAKLRPNDFQLPGQDE